MVYVNIQKVKFNDLYWQGLTYSTNPEIHWHLFSAYYDTRTLLYKHPVIRIMGIIGKKQNVHNLNTYCQIWYANDTKYII